jgi:glycosyltransferase involved in cell wall biosynthesis
METDSVMIGRKKVKILRIITRLNIGGPSFHTILLTAHLNPKIFRSKLVKGEEGKQEGEMNDLLERKKVIPEVISQLGREISWKDDLLAFWKLYRLIRQEKPDIVHTHMAKAGTLGRLAAKLAGVSIIVHTFHGHVFHSYFGAVKTKVFITIEKFLALLTTQIVAVSPSQKEEILHYKIAPSQKVVCIPLGLELDLFLKAEKEKGRLRAELSLNPDHKLVGIIARLVPVKGHSFLFEAAQRVIPLFPQVKFLVVGDGPLRKELEDLVDQMDIKRNVIFLGFRKDLPKIYADLDVVILTSLNEGLPVAVIEGMAAAKPVVAFDVGGVKDLVQANFTGILVPFGDAHRLADSIMHLLKDPQECERLGQNARRKAYPYLDYRRLVKDMENFYCQLLRNKVNYLDTQGVNGFKNIREGVGAS